MSEHDLFDLDCCVPEDALKNGQVATNNALNSTGGMDAYREEKELDAADGQKINLAWWIPDESVLCRGADRITNTTRYLRSSASSVRLVTWQGRYTHGWAVLACALSVVACS